MAFSLFSRPLSLVMLAIAGVSVAAAQSYTLNTIAGGTFLRDNVPATTAPLRGPYGVATDSSGNIYIADRADHRVRRVAPNGTITTVAGNGFPDFSGDNGRAVAASLFLPQAVALDRNGNLYIADYYNNRVRRVVLSTGIITTVAGNGNYRYAGDGRPATQAQFDPEDIAVDGNGDLYIADYSNHRIRKVVISTGIISTIAGTGIEGFSGDAGPATSARLSRPSGISVDGAGNVYFCDTGNNVIRKIATNGTITTVVGTGGVGSSGDGGPATQATLRLPLGLAADSAGNLAFVDLNNNKIRRVDAATQVITTVAGNGNIGFTGDGGPATQATLAFPSDVTFGPNGTLLIADEGNFRVRQVANGTITTVAGTGVGDNGPGTSAIVNRPAGVAAGPDGSVYFSDSNNARVRRLLNGTVTTVAGTGILGSREGRIAFPEGLAVDAAGNVYFAEAGNDQVQRFTPNGQPQVVAGGTGTGFSGDGGPATSAALSGPTGVAIDSTGNLYIADADNNRVRRVAPSGIITTVAGNGQDAASGDGGQATAAGMTVYDVAVDTAGNLYIADGDNNRIRKVTIATGIITTVAGDGSEGYSGDGGAATRAQLAFPTGVAVGVDGSIYIADYDNQVVRKVDPAGVITTIAGNGDVLFDGESGPALNLAIDPYKIAVDRAGVVYIADYLNDRIRSLTPAATGRLTVVSGNNQSGVPGARLGTPLVVKVTDANGAAVAGTRVDFAVTSGSATVSPTSATTGADGTASTTVTLGNVAGTVTISASAAGLSTTVFTLTVSGSGGGVLNPPAINTSGIVGAGLSGTPVRALSSNGIVTIFGQNFAAAGTVRQVVGSDVVNNRLPTNLGGVCVLVNGTRAPIFAVTDSQINFQVPAVPSSGNVPVQVVTGCDTANEQRSPTQTVAVQAVAPEFFYFVLNSNGNNPIAALDGTTNQPIGTPGLLPGGTFTPAKPGSVVVIFGTGFGATNPGFAPGELAGQAGRVPGTVQVTLGGRVVPAANIEYIGVAPGYAGLYQLNLRIPADTPSGNQPVTLTINGVPSPTTGYLAVQP